MSPLLCGKESNSSPSITSGSGPLGRWALPEIVISSRLQVLYSLGEQLPSRSSLSKKEKGTQRHGWMPSVKFLISLPGVE